MMMSGSGFPVAVQSPVNDNGNRNEPGILVELVDLMQEFAIRMLVPQNKNEKTIESVIPPSEAQRIAMASNVATPVNMMEFLSRDVSAVVRSELVFNSALPVHILHRLAGDNDRFVAAQARARIANAA